MAQKLTQLDGGFYKAPNLIANAQRCLNVFPEANHAGAPVKFTHYQTPGLLTLANPGVTVRCRGAYKATNGQLFEVVGGTVYYTDPTWARIALGSIAALTTPVIMKDNGLVLVIVDGTPNGYVVDLSTHAFSVISDSSFYGSRGIGYTDTYFVFNRIGTTQWYLSPQNWNGVDPFDPLDIADKVGGADNVATVITMKEDVWVIGDYTTQVYYNAAGQDFTFAPISGVFIEHGTAAPYSVVQSDLAILFLAQDDDGAYQVFMAKDYGATRISTHAIEKVIAEMGTVDDCIGLMYQQNGHTHAMFVFPTGDKTLVYDITTDLWHERAWIDGDGLEHRIRANSCATAYGKTVVGDWENGKLYHYDPKTFDDDGQPIKRVRSFPHILSNGYQVEHRGFVAYLNPGSAGAVLDIDQPFVSLRWSNTGGVSWKDPVTMGLGAQGDYGLQVQRKQLGLARDRVYELSWSAPVDVALNGAFLDLDQAAA